MLAFDFYSLHYLIVNLQFFILDNSLHHWYIWHGLTEMGGWLSSLKKDISFSLISVWGTISLKECRHKNYSFYLTVSIIRLIISAVQFIFYVLFYTVTCKFQILPNVILVLPQFCLLSHYSTIYISQGVKFCETYLLADTFSVICLSSYPSICQSVTFSALVFSRWGMCSLEKSSFSSIHLFVNRIMQTFECV